MASSDEDPPKISQIPLLNDIVYDQDLPLRPPPKPRATRQTRDHNHGPDYDPDTMDLFDDVESPTDLRIEASRMVDELVDEYSEEILHRLREELTEQLTSLLGDLEQENRDPSKP